MAGQIGGIGQMHHPRTPKLVCGIEAEVKSRTQTPDLDTALSASCCHRVRTESVTPSTLQPRTRYSTARPKEAAAPLTTAAAGQVAQSSTVVHQQARHVDTDDGDYSCIVRHHEGVHSSHRLTAVGTTGRSRKWPPSLPPLPTQATKGSPYYLPQWWNLILRNWEPACAVRNKYSAQRRLAERKSDQQRSAAPAITHSSDTDTFVNQIWGDTGTDLVKPFSTPLRLLHIVSVSHLPPPQRPRRTYICNFQQHFHVDDTTDDNMMDTKEQKGFQSAQPFSSDSSTNDNEMVGQVHNVNDVEKAAAAQASSHFHRLGWKRLTVVLIVEAIALGSLSMPGAFATLGMVAGVILSLGLGLIAIYTSYVVGQVKLKYPEVQHYADAGRLLMGRFGYELVGFMFSMQLIFLVGSHTLTGTIAFLNITDNATCSIAFGVVSAIILLCLAIPPSFAEVAILGYIDFVSIICAIGITIIATGVQRGDIGTAADWSAWPAEDLTFVKAFIAITNIVFAYSFAICQFSFMDEMHTPKDFVKSIWALGIIEIIIYTLTGALIYSFVGSEVKSPALLSAGPLVSKVAFGIALPVIFISGSINTTVVGRYIHGRVYKDTVTRFINDKKGWATWLALITVITIIAWIIAEAIPFFSDLLSISSALFISGFTFYFPAMMWFKLIRQGGVFARENILKTLVNALVFIIGIITLVGGTYSSIADIADGYREGTVRGAFSCAPL
ncbi:Uu.00g075710.m01.CDS01 [Anthostomella pinea]|uniref:Uu.00g075710.m01.CDS01 n=1 Tax=Anthostomella pinea TaxID=933095 RepID=A0AAI8YPA2_9PEZI|nr:Uu.00g075710.m01.CDS01 [Anthostomella pinea]